MITSILLKMHMNQIWSNMIASVWYSGHIHCNYDDILPHMVIEAVLTASCFFNSNHGLNGPLKALA
jgi:hypothetical protein